jgi:hypothetical protein
VAEVAQTRPQTERPSVPAPAGRIVGRPHAVPTLDPVPQRFPETELAQSPRSRASQPSMGQVSISASPQPTLPTQESPLPPPGPTRFDQLKSILAVIGVIALLFHTLRLVAVAAES